MNKLIGKRVPPSDPDPRPASERRRTGHVVHDERGTASLEWLDAPGDFNRPVLELADGPGKSRDDVKLRRGFEPKLSIRNEDSFNPYDRKPETFGGGIPAAPRSAKRDLRKLSEWMKMMRTLEERKKNGDGD